MLNAEKFVKLSVILDIIQELDKIYNSNNYKN